MPKSHQFEWKGKETAAANARRELPALVSRYFALVREVLARNPAPAELHQLRLATKRLRYTLELFQPCYGAGLETRLAGLREIQRLLGEVNDSAASAPMLGKVVRKTAWEARVKTFLEERAARQAREFRQHWEDIFDASGREHWWTAYLEQPDSTPAGQPD